MSDSTDTPASIRASDMCVAWCIRTRRPYMGEANPFFDDPTMADHDDPETGTLSFFDSFSSARDTSATDYTEHTLTFSDIIKAQKELGHIPKPPTLLARPEFVSKLMSRIEKVIDRTPGLLPGVPLGVPIKEVESLSVRWVYTYDGKTTFETLEGEVRSFVTPEPDFSIPLPPRLDPEPMRAWAQVRFRGVDVGYPFRVTTSHDRPRPPKRKRRSEGWRRHVRRVKAAGRPL